MSIEHYCNLDGAGRAAYRMGYADAAAAAAQQLEGTRDECSVLHLLRGMVSNMESYERMTDADAMMSMSVNREYLAGSWEC